MGRALEITRMDHTSAELRTAAGKSSDAAQVRRLLAIALVLDGDARRQAAEQTGMDRQTLRDWRDKVVRWRCIDLREEIACRFSVEVHESTVGKWLHQLGLTRLQPRPCHPKKVAAEEEAFKKTSALC